MKNNVYPVFMCNDIKKEARFFMEQFDFEEVFSSEWYISLKDKDGFELAMIDSHHETIPNRYRKSCEGCILNIEVDDADALYLKIKNNKQTSLIVDIKNEDYGQRHFMIETPSKILIDVIQMILPSDEYIENYKETGEQNG